MTNILKCKSTQKKDQTFQHYISVFSTRLFCNIPTSKEEENKYIETELLSGEPINIIKQCGEYSFIQAPLQTIFNSDILQPYEGWIKSNSFQLNSNTLAHFIINEDNNHILPLGSIIKSNKPTEIRPFNINELIKYAMLLEKQNTPYKWGGCSSKPENNGDSFGLDCSGFIYILYRIQGIILPRNARDQFKLCTTTKSPSVGDLLFLKEENQKNISHVILYVNDSLMIDAAKQTEKVRLLTKDLIRFDSHSSRWIITNKATKQEIAYIGEIRKVPFGHPSLSINKYL